MRTVSFQGTQLTPGQRRQLSFQQQARQPFLNPILQQQIDAALAEHERLKAQGLKAENPYKYSLDYVFKGTPWLGDVFGF